MAGGSSRPMLVASAARRLDQGPGRPAGCPGARAPSTAGCQAGTNSRADRKLAQAGGDTDSPSLHPADAAMKCLARLKKPGHSAVSGMLLVLGVSALSVLQVADRQWPLAGSCTPWPVRSGRAAEWR